MNTSQENVRSIVHDLVGHLSKNQANLEAAQHSMTQCLGRLISIESLFEQGIPRDASHHGKIESVTVYFDPEITVVMGKFDKGHVIPPHAHDTWEMVGVYQGELEYESYRRRDAVANSDGDLILIESRLLKKGEVAFCPGKEESHSFRAITNVVTIAARGLVGGKVLEIRGNQLIRR